MGPLPCRHLLHALLQPRCHAQELQGAKHKFMCEGLEKHRDRLEVKGPLADTCCMRSFNLLHALFQPRRHTQELHIIS